MKYLKYILILIFISSILFCASIPINKSINDISDVPVLNFDAGVIIIVEIKDGLDLDGLCINIKTNIATLRLVNIKDGSVNDCGLLDIPYSVFTKMDSKELLVYIVTNLNTIRKCDK